MDYRNAHLLETDMMSYEDFLGELCYSMIHNNYNATTMYTDTRSLKRKANDLTYSPAVVLPPHTVQPLLILKDYQEKKLLWQAKRRRENKSIKGFRAQKRCEECGEKCSHFCITCSTASTVVAICNPTGDNKSTGTCHAKHIAHC